ncbi:MAG: NUDIX domain-containing protein, partial [Patescibacteria group bacterium]
MKKATLCLLIKENQEDRKILLAMKKRGFGVGKWNGVGGKVDTEKGDMGIVDAAIRETKEEIGVQIKELEKVAIFNFYFPSVPKDKNWNQEVHVFLIRNWEGEPVETEEMAPRWFKESDIPF